MKIFYVTNRTGVILHGRVDRMMRAGRLVHVLTLSYEPLTKARIKPYAACVFFARKLERRRIISLDGTTLADGSMSIVSAIKGLVWTQDIDANKDIILTLDLVN